MPDCVCGQLGCADGLRRGQTVRGGQNIDMHGYSRARGGSISGGDETHEGEVCLLRELQDGISLLTVHNAGQCGGPSSVGEQ